MALVVNSRGMLWNRAERCEMLWNHTGMLWNVVQFRRMLWNVMKCCEMLWKPKNVVKIPPGTSPGPPDLGGFGRFQISQHSAGAKKIFATNFSARVHTFYRSSIQVDVFEASAQKRPSDFPYGLKMLWNVVKCCEIEFHNISQHFAIFHNIPDFFTTFHNIYGKLGNVSFPTHPGSPPTSQ